MPDVEGLGDAVTGGLAARAVEPGHGEAADGHTHERNCLNCSTPLAGDYCHNCGQRAHVHRTLGAFWHDMVHGVLHVEGKIWRTLPLLAWRPGELTRRYVDGQRARFVSPIAIFLFSVFLMFAVISLLGSPTEFSDVSNTPGQDRAEAEREIRAERAEAQKELAGLTQELAQARAAGQPTGGIEGEMAGVRTALAAQERAYQIALRVANEQEQRERSAEQSAPRDGPRVKIGAEAVRELRKEPEINLLTETGWAPLDRAIAKAESNPSLLFYKIQSNAYKFSWALIPISLPFLWLLFLHRRRYRHDYGAYDHIVFITYSIAFMSLGAVALAVLRAIGVAEGLTGAAMAFVPPVHIYRQLRGAYDLGKWSAIWRTAALLVFAFIALGLFFIVLVGFGVLS